MMRWFVGRGTAPYYSQHSFPGLQPACAAAGLTVRYLCKGPQFNAAALEGIKVVIIFADGFACHCMPYSRV